MPRRRERHSQKAPKGIAMGVSSGVVNSSDYRDCFPPASGDGGKVRFRAAYDKEPKVFAALSHLNMDAARHS